MADLDMLNQAIDYVAGQFEKLNQKYIKKIAKQIKKIGELSQANINRLIIMQAMNQNMGEIRAELARLTNRSIQDIAKIYDEALMQTYTDPRFRDVIDQKPLNDSQKQVLGNIARNIAVQTAGQMENYSNTTAVSKVYRQTVDKAILAVTSGIEDYNSAMRSSIRELGYNGMRIEYESGYHRRLDSAVRQNIVDGVNQIAQEASLKMGEIYSDDFDSIELSAHAMSAPDHEPVQGRVFLLEEFDKLQTEQESKDINGKKHPAMRRAIGQWNCKHIAMAFSTKYNKPRYTEEQLQEFERKNHEGCMINGKHYTTYEASQLMRETETRIRREKDVAVAAQEAGDEELQQECQSRINQMSKEYQNIAKQAGLRPQMQRTSVEGFEAVESKDSETKTNENESSRNHGDLYTKDTQINTEKCAGAGLKKRIDMLGEDAETSRNLFITAKEILAHRNRTHYEDLGYIYPDGNRTVNMNYDYYDAVKGLSACKPTKRMDKEIKTYKPHSVIGVHNHPGSNCPSIADIIAAAKRQYKYGVVFAHDGTIYKYSVKESYNMIEVFSRLDELQKLIYNNKKDVIAKCLDDLSTAGVNMEIIP